MKRVLRREEMAYREMLCHVCGSNEFDELGGKLKCKYCKTEYVKEEEESEELRRARALFYSAEKELEVLHFENLKISPSSTPNGVPAIGASSARSSASIT